MTEVELWKYCFKTNQQPEQVLQKVAEEHRSTVLAYKQKFANTGIGGGFPGEYTAPVSTDQWQTMQAEQQRQQQTEELARRKQAVDAKVKQMDAQHRVSTAKAKLVGEDLATQQAQLKVQEAQQAAQTAAKMAQQTQAVQPAQPSVQKIAALAYIIKQAADSRGTYHPPYVRQGQMADAFNKRREAAKNKAASGNKPVQPVQPLPVEGHPFILSQEDLDEYNRQTPEQKKYIDDLGRWLLEKRKSSKPQPTPTYPPVDRRGTQPGGFTGAEQGFDPVDYAGQGAHKQREQPTGVESQDNKTTNRSIHHKLMSVLERLSNYQKKKVGVDINGQ